MCECGQQAAVHTVNTVSPAKCKSGCEVQTDPYAESGFKVARAVPQTDNVYSSNCC